MWYYIRFFKIYHNSNLGQVIFDDVIISLKLCIFMNKSYSIWPRTKSTYFQHDYAMQLAVLKHLYLNIFLFVLRASGLGLISSIRLDGRKDIQSVKSVSFTERKPLLLPFLTRITNGVKQTSHRL